MERRKSQTSFCILRWAVTGLALSSLVSGCAQVVRAYQPNPAPALPLPVMPVANLEQAPPGKRTDGSLWSTEQSVNPFAEDKAFRRGDIVLVRVIQKSSGTKKANTDTSRGSSISANIKYALGVEKEINKLTGVAASATGAAGAAGAAASTSADLLNAKSSSAYKGAGSTERDDQLEATVSAVVTDVLTNGNMVIYGHQTVQLNNESSVLTVQGIVRPSDITFDNTIDSGRIANANIQFTGSGVLTDKQHPGWGTRIVDWVWPF